MQSIVPPGRRVRWHRRRALVALALIALAPLSALQAQEPRRTELQIEHTATHEAFGQLFDAMVGTVERNFWDKERLTRLDWAERARQTRQSVVTAPDRDEAARRLNALLGELKSSHTVLLTPDDVDYYVLKDVFGTRQVYDGIGMFSAHIGDRDFVDLILEGYPAARAGLKVGDEIVSIDGGPYHPVRSFRGRRGEVTVAIRRVDGGSVIPIEVEVVGISPLEAFTAATLDSARVIERDGRRIGYIHVWASLRDMDVTLSQALGRLGIKRANNKTTNAGNPVDAVIIDMRGKIGGTANLAKRYLEVIDPRGPEIEYRVPGGSPPYSLRNRTAVLIDQHTRSTAELFVHSYKREHQGPLIGSTTAAAVVAGGQFAMPGENLLYLATSGLVVDGDVIEGTGVAPDIAVQRPLPYAAGADPVLEAAVKQLTRVPPRSFTQQDLHTDSQ
jgi:carboxyl-terminal processing protease